MPTIDSSNDVALATELYSLLNVALQRWGRCVSTDYPAFQDIVALHLASVERTATTQILPGPSPHPITNADRQRAVWYLIRDAIALLRPPSSIVGPVVDAALDRLDQSGWPREVAVPPESHHYLVLMLAYVVKSYPNKTLAALLNVPPRTLANVRNAAIAEVARRLAAWERVQIDAADGTSLQLPAP